MQGLAAVLLSLEKVPVIRYQGFSELARRLAERVNVIKRIRMLDLFSFKYVLFIIIMHFRM